MSGLADVFLELKLILKPFAALLDVKQDDDKCLYVDTRFIQANKKPVYFGGVMLKKAFVSYHLMPVYLKPELLDGISIALRKRMQGKSCFNFSKVDDHLFAELTSLTRAGFQSYRDQGFV